MTFDELQEWTKHIGTGQKLPAQMKHRIVLELPAFIEALSPRSAPKRLKLPTGESLTDATRMTALKCQCLLLARKTFGPDYTKAHTRYEALAKDVLFWVMRHHFNTSDPKRVFCCASCALSLLPLYALGCFRWVDCKELQANVLAALAAKQTVFRRAYPKAYAQWAMEIAK